MSGVDYATNMRHSLHPYVINTESWEPVHCIVSVDFPHASTTLSGHSMLQVKPDVSIIVGGYKQNHGEENEEACNKILILI